MGLDRVGSVALRQPEVLPSLFATAEADTPRASRTGQSAAAWPVRIRVLGQQVAALRLTLHDRSTASW